MHNVINMVKNNGWVIIGPSDESIDIVLVTGHAIKQPSEYLHLYPQMCAALNLGQISCSLQ